MVLIDTLVCVFSLATCSIIDILLQCTLYVFLCWFFSQLQWFNMWTENSTSKSVKTQISNFYYECVVYRGAYGIACLGVTEEDWRLLALEALEVSHYIIIMT